MTTLSASRAFPPVNWVSKQAGLPISFVVVKFSDDFHHNIICSPCVHDSINQLIVVDNQCGVHFGSLSAAINEGLAQAVHDIVVIVHDDVLLQAGWQQQFELAISALNEQDPQWAVCGAVGRALDGSERGHWSDPRQYKNTMGERLFQEIDEFDEQIMVVRKNSPLAFDSSMPSIHNIGEDLCRQAKKLQLNTYIINAPSIHKYCDASGDLIADISDSEKIAHRESSAYQAELHFCNRYFEEKWGIRPKYGHWVSDITQTVAQEGDSTVSQLQNLTPLIVFGVGDSDTQLARLMAEDMGYNMDIADWPEFNLPIYHCLLSELEGWQRDKSVMGSALSRAIHYFIETNALLNSASWGISRSELPMLLPLIDAIFPRAQYLFMVKDPLVSGVAGMDVTGQLDNEIGRAVLRASYDHLNLSRSEVLEHSGPLQMAVATAFQYQKTFEFFERIEADRYQTIFWGDLMASPEMTMKRIELFLATERIDSKAIRFIEQNPSIRETRLHTADLETSRMILERVREQIHLFVH